jgi:hypothetical protein
MADQKGIPEIQLTATASRPLGQRHQHVKWDTSPPLNAPVTASRIVDGQTLPDAALAS